MSRIRFLPVALALMCVAGCGGGDSDSDAIADTTRSFFASIRDEEWDEACAQLARGAQQRLADYGTDCPGVLREAADSFGDVSDIDLDDLEIEDVRVDGDRATAEVSPSTSDERLPFEREDGRWRIATDAFDPAPRTAAATTAPAEDPELEVESGFTRVQDRKTSWGVQVRNPSDETAVDVEVRIAFAGDGATDSRTIAILPAGGSAWVGGETDTPRTVRDLDVSALAADWTDDPAPLTPSAPGTVVNTSFNVAVKGEIVNRTDAPLDEDTRIYAVLLERGGRIVGGITGFPDAPIAPRASAQVTLVGLGPVRDATRARISADAARP